MTVFKVNNRPAKTWNGLVNELFANLENNFATVPATYGQVPVNIFESENAYQLELAAPGRSKEDFKLSVHDNQLTIGYEAKNETKTSDAKEIRKEFSYQSFKRSFNLHDKVNAEGIEARYENGILTVSLPKKAETKPEVKQISIL